MFLGCASSQDFAQIAAPPDRLAGIKKLFDEERWEELVKKAESLPARGAEADYYYGFALSRLGRWDEARTAFLAGQRLRPRDERFPIELGGVSFKQKRYAEAARWLERGLRLAPNDAYANDFLATIYFLEDNLEAALKYWNRVAKPRIESVRVEPGLRVEPALLDRAMAFAPAGTLRLSDLLTSEFSLIIASTWRRRTTEGSMSPSALRSETAGGTASGKRCLQHSAARSTRRFTRNTPTGEARRPTYHPSRAGTRKNAACWVAYQRPSSTTRSTAMRLASICAMKIGTFVHRLRGRRRCWGRSTFRGKRSTVF